MKYLKIYELFKVIYKSENGNIENSDKTDIEREQSLREICLELEDLDYNIKINRDNNSILIINKDSGDDRRLSWDIIKDHLLRMKDFLGDDFISFHYLDTPSWQWKCIKLNEQSDFTFIKLISVAIEYKN